MSWRTWRWKSRRRRPSPWIRSVAIEARLAAQPEIVVPSIVLLGADDGVGPPPATDTDARHFTGPYRREIVAGVGHNFPQEAPDAFAAAVRALL